MKPETTIVSVAKKERFIDLYSERAKGLKASEVRELLKLTQKKDIISFAGGLPNPEAFPETYIKEILSDILDTYGTDPLQYGTTEGLNLLREAIAEWHNKDKKMDIGPENILITHGSQQGLDLLAKVFLDPNDIVVLGEPTYLGGTGTYNAFQAKMETVPLDSEGMIPDELRQKMHYLHRHGQNPKFLYVIPCFQNPSGVTMSQKRREEIMEIAKDYDLLVIEDNPYGELRYRGDYIPPMKSMDDEGRIIYFGTFSKILAPGFRIAWTIADKEIIDKMVMAKQATDLCTNTFGQYVAYEFIKRGHLHDHIKTIRKIYGKKQKIMLDAMDEHFPDEVSWTKPDGGMFTWAILPEYMSTKRMFKYAIKEKVAYVTGTAFFPNGGGDNCMRLNFTHPKDEDIPVGIERLANVIRKEMVRQKEEPTLGFETPVQL